MISPLGGAVLDPWVALDPDLHLASLNGCGGDPPTPHLEIPKIYSYADAVVGILVCVARHLLSGENYLLCILGDGRYVPGCCSDEANPWGYFGNWRDQENERRGAQEQTTAGNNEDPREIHSIVTWNN